MSTPLGNSLLEALPDFAQDLAAALELVNLRPKDVLYDAGRAIDLVYFPITSVVSIVSMMESGASAEVALVGREGIVGLSALLGGWQSPLQVIVQIEGTAFRTTAAAVKAARNRSGGARDLLNLYTEAHLIQIAQTAACNRLHHVDGRLARWLLSIHDRVGRDSFRLTQEFIAQMLGIRRPTVTTAMRRFQRDGLIRTRGREIAIVDRRRLEAAACECYRLVKREFGRLLNHPIVDQPGAPESLPSPNRLQNERDTAVETLREVASRLLVAGIREQEAREEAEAADRRKDFALAAISHELRGPLTAILGWSRLLLDRADPDASRRGLEIIERNARAQMRLVEDLLDHSRIAQGTLTIVKDRASIVDILETALDAVRPLAEERRVTLDLTLETMVPSVSVDADRIRQVLVNLLTNALEFTGEGGRIAIDLQSVGNAVCLVIRDTGAGIAPEILPHIFEKFQQGERPRTAAGGLGLGLTIARTLVELHGGALRIESEGLGRGTTCTVELPAAASHHLASGGTRGEIAE